ncbi:Mfs general substrate transporter [Lasiodiplodia theobromae]|uniref:Mfs general substrate transporter n=1 Tax=Lasiodiplodia theobromae TaxID=45133 RepID=UPI0015C38D48|nr:Mfs general substrate transporter [Lasiodiplodia theobromae]KAF4537193.1 Mfs general substrate transporter [Lasiodiplodia theobromae]
MENMVHDTKEKVEHVDRVDGGHQEDAIHMENAVGYREYLAGLDIEVSEKEARAVRWKIDLIILPAFLITQALQFMDKTALNYANLFDYQEALGLHGQQFNYLSASAVRFIMGIFEAAVTPSALGWGGIAGSYISMGVSKLPADMTPERWELIFYILGGVTCVWAFIVWFLLPDSPSNAWFLKQRERLVAVKRVSGNETGIKNKSFDRKQAVVAFQDPKAILLFISVFAAAIPNGVVNSFSTIIIRDMGFGTTKTTELKSVGDATQIVALFIGGAITLNVRNSRLLTATAANILCTVSAALLAYLPRSSTWGRLVCFWLVNAQSVGFTVSLTTISSNMAGYTHRSLASALVFTAYCWGNFAGPFVVKGSEAPYYEGASIGLLVGYSIKLGCHLLLLAYMFLENRRRNRIHGPQNKEESDKAGMLDQTEFENKNFRYVL